MISIRPGLQAGLDTLDEKIWDLVVIGAGPAGGMAAYLAAKTGMRTLLVERQSFPRAKVCGGCLNAAGVDLLNRVGLEEIPQKYGLPIDQFCLGLKHRRVEMAVPAGVAITRTDLDHALVQAAVAQGVSFLPETTATPDRLQPDHREVRLAGHGENRIVRSKSVIVATGLKGLGGGEPDSARAFETRVARGSRIGTGCLLPGEFSDYPAGSIFMAIGRRGYVGLTATREGLGVASACDARLLKETQGPGAGAVEILHEAGFAVPGGLQHANWAGTLPLTRKTRPVAAYRLFLAGDAAGYVEPFTGQGMAIALQSAAELVPILKDAMRENSGKAEQDWSRFYQMHVANRHWPAALMARLLRRPMVASVAFGLASHIPRSSQCLIQAINRTIEIPSAPEWNA
ncbi:MAG: NAD(P)/FAD-dependent oxidoreductase [bacterium]